MLIERSVIFVTHRALLGVIGTDIIGISMTENDSNLIMNVFYQVDLSEEQVDALEIATTEIYSTTSDIYRDVILCKQRVESTLIIPRIGEYVFLRLGVGLGST